MALPLLASRRWWRLSRSACPGGRPAALVYAAIGPSLIAYRWGGIGVAAVGPAIAAFFANLTPVFAALLSVALLGEAPKAYHAVAFALTVAGIAVSSRRRRPRVG